MNKTVILALYSALFVLLVYLGWAFALWQINPGLWDGFDRTTCAAFMAWAGFSVIMLKLK